MKSKIEDTPENRRTADAVIERAQQLAVEVQDAGENAPNILGLAFLIAISKKRPADETEASREIEEMIRRVAPELYWTSVLQTATSWLARAGVMVCVGRDLREKKL